MLGTDRKAFICDMAETYGIFDIDRVPVDLLSTLAVGLGENSRINLKKNGLKARWEIVLLALIADLMSGETDPRKRVAPAFFISEKKKDGNVMVFDSADDFDEARARILGGKEDGRSG